MRDPAAVLALAESVLADLGPDRPRWHAAEVIGDPAAAPQVHVVLADERGRPQAQVVAAVGFPVSQAVATLADQVQDAAVESAEAWGRPLPPCPRHGTHPLSARWDEQVPDAAAGWWCPADHARVRDVATGRA